MGKNDWIVASINNPSFSSEDMEDIFGMTIDNTLMLSKQAYKNSPYIKNHIAFKNEDGSFSETKFDQFYEKALKEWDKFTNNEKIDSYEYSLFHTRSEAGSRVKNPNFRIETVLNPDLVTIGIAGWNQTKGKKLYTPSELAQMQKIYDPSTGTYLDETPNDRALFNSPIKWVKNLFEEPLVLATYDEDTEEFDPFSGKVVLHKKGEYKLNSDGTYYSEKLNGRSVAGKQIIHNTDLITVDDSSINKYDFFDSDSIDKSVVGTILKSAATVAPLFLGGPVSKIYSGLLIARELSKTLPMLYGITTSLFGNESEPEFLNTLAGYGEKLSGGISEYGSQHTFSFELFGKLLSDVATLWGLQQLIARSISKLRGSNSVMLRAYDLAANKYSDMVVDLLKRFKLGQQLTEEELNILRLGTNAENWAQTSIGKVALSKYMPAAEAIVKRNSRLGADAALAYMALVSNYDVYNTMLEKGATHKDASIVSLMSTVGMFGVDKYLHLGEMFFDDLEDLAQKHIRAYAKKQAADWMDAYRLGAGMNTAERIEGNILKRISLNSAKRNAELGEATLIRKGLNLGRAIGEEASNTIKNYSEGIAHHTLSASGKALGEGLEEMSEEFVSDISKQLYEWAGLLGIDTSIKDAGAWDNWFDRYAMSFLGGFAGGGIFYGVGKFEEAKSFSKNSDTKSAEEEMIYLLRQHKKDDIIRELSKLHDEGKLGSTKLGLTVELSDKGKVFLNAETGALTQNDAVFNFITQEINILDSYLNEYGANLSEDELFEQMVLADDRLMSMKAQLNGQSYTANYRQNFLDIVSNLFKVKAEIEANDNSLTDLQKRKKEAEDNKQDVNPLLSQILETTLKKSTLEKQLKTFESQLNDFTSGKASMEYARKTTWLADPILSAIWTYNTFDLWLLKKYDLEVDKLSNAEREKYLQEYTNDLNYKKDFDTDEAWKSFLEVEKAFTPYLTRLELNPQEILKIKDLFNQLADIRQKLNDVIGFIKITDRVPNESDEDFNNPTQHKINVDKYNLELIQKDADDILPILLNIVNLFQTPGIILDPQTYRLARSLFLDINKNFAYQYALNHILFDTSGTFSKNLESENIKLIKDVLKTSLEAIKLKKEAKGNQLFDDLKNIRTFLQALNNDPVKAISDLDLFNLPFSFIGENFSEIYDENDNISQSFIDEISKNPNKALEFISKVNSEVDNWFNNNIATIYSQDLSTNLETAIIDQLLAEIQNINTLEDLNNLTTTVALTGDLGNDINELILTINESINTLYNSLQTTKSLDELSTSLQQSQINIISNLTTALKSFKVKLNLIEESKSPKTVIDKWISDMADNLTKEINLNPFIQFVNTANQVIKDANPLKEISQIAAQKFGLNEVELENILDKIESKFDSNDVADFVLQPHEEQTLAYLNHLLNIISGFLYQSSISPTWLNSFGHAKFWNDFAQKHSDVVGQGFHLPEIDADVANLFRGELGRYQTIIQNWKALHDNNAVNKELLFNRAAEKLEEVKLEFYKLNIKYLRGILINGSSFDLLDEIKDTDTSLDIETKIANNLYNILVSENISLKEFLDKSKLIENIIPDGINGVIEFKTTDLDDKLDYKDLSPYLKFQILITPLLLNSSKFESINKNKLTPESEIAPIAILKYIIQSGKGFINSTYAINQIYEYISPYLSKDVAILDLAMIIEGIGGAGKTSACAVLIVEDIPESEIWTAAPTDTQLGNLNIAIKKNPSRTFDRNQLMDEVLEDVKEYNKSVLNTLIKVGAKSDKNFRKISQGEQFIDTGNLKLKQSKNKSRVLIIDEATQFSCYDLQLINRWAKENGVRLILIGDDHQLGAVESPGFRNTFTLFRMPKLKTSLRESNIHVQRNNAAIDKVVETLSVEWESKNKDADDEKALKLIAETLYKDLELSYFINLDELHGTLITKSLPDNVLEVLKKSNSVAFVGNVNSERMKQLKDAGITFKDEDLFKTIKDIQSKEYEYVIYDNDIESELQGHDVFWGDIVLTQAKALYTLNTRSKKGVIIIDNNFLQAYPVQNNQYASTAEAKTIADAVKSFVTKEIDRLLNLSLDGEYHDLSELEEPKTIDNQDTTPEDILDLENQEEKIKDQVIDILNELDKDTNEADENLSNLLNNTDEVEPSNLNFSLNTIGYSMPILGGYTRIKSGDKNIYQKLPTEIINGKTILKDLSIITFILKVKSKELSEEELKNAVDSYYDMIRLIASLAAERSIESGFIETNIIDPADLKNILLDKSTRLLADGRLEGVYLEAVDPSDGDKFFGLTDADESLMTIDGKVYKYVLRFIPTNMKNFADGNTEIALTLGLAANPETWEKKLNGFDLNDPEEVQKKKDLEQNIKSYKQYLLEIKEKHPKGIRVNITGAFSKIRKLDYPTRLSTLYIKNRRLVDFDKGWLENAGKYKVHSPIYIVGKDTDALGIKACNSGKAVMFVSDFDYRPEELFTIYQNEKNKNEYKCTVRMLILDNVGINWSSLTNINYKELYGNDTNVSTPFKADIMGYRLLAAMWNWRADLINFLNAYKKEFTDLGIEDEKVINIANAITEIYDIHKSIPTTKDGIEAFSTILTKYGITSDDILKLNNFNDVICKDIHTFRVGGDLKHNKHVQSINVDPKEYFGDSRIPKYIDESGVKGLFITPTLAKEYLDYVNALFKVFSLDGESLLDIEVYRDGVISKYSITDRINGDKLGSLTHFKKSNASEASPNLNNSDSDNTAGSITSFFKGGTNGIEISDGNGNVYKIKLGEDRDALHFFTHALIHLFSRLKQDVYHAANGDRYNKGNIVIKGKDDLGNETETTLNYSELLKLILDSYTKNLPLSGIANQLSDPFTDSMFFEFGDMFDLMLHGSLQDVATTGMDRDNTDKISGIMFPEGMFVDPRSKGGVKGDKDNPTLIETNIDPRLLLLDALTDLVFNITLPSLTGTPTIGATPEPTTNRLYIFEKQDENSYHIKMEIDESIDTSISLTENSLLPRDTRTIKEIIPQLGTLEINNGKGIATISGEEYQVVLNIDGLHFTKKQTLNPSNNVSSTKYILDEDEDFSSLFDSDITDGDLINFIYKILKDNNIELSENETILIPSSNIDIITNKGRKIGFLKQSENNDLEVEIVITPEAMPESLIDVNTSVPMIPSEEIGNIPNDSIKSVLEYWKSNSDKFNIKGNYLAQLNEILENDQLLEEIDLNLGTLKDTKPEYAWIDELFNEC